MKKFLIDGVSYSWLAIEFRSPLQILYHLNTKTCVDIVTFFLTRSAKKTLKNLHLKKEKRQLYTVLSQMLGRIQSQN